VNTNSDFIDKPSETVKRDSSFEEKCYEIIKGKVLIGIVDQLIQGITTLEECKRRCQKSKEVSDIICKSAIFYEKEKECIIASQSRSDIPDLFIEDDQAVYIENTCLSQSGSSIKKLQKMGETVPEISTQDTPTTTKVKRDGSKQRL
ncbi:PAN domain protein, partial [Oesophagostomum dentatum]